jgi:PST family polysaccharide transporter
MGASAGINLLLSMLRVKLVAIFAGTVGIGMIATYSALLTTIVTVVSMGIHISAVRHIALASVANNEEQLTRSVVALKRLSWVLGISGMLVVAVLSNQLSFWTLGTAGYAWDVVLLSSVILFNAVSSSYSCIIQGARRVGDLARINVYGAFFATVAAFVCLYVLGDEGVIWTLITAAVLQMLVSRIYANQVRISSIKQNWKESIDIGLKLITEGAPQMLSILASTLSTLIILSSITRELGVNSVGLYSAAFALSGAFVGFMLVSMSADYYPRLIEAGNDKNSINRIVNEQTEISLLLVVPGLLLCVFCTLAVKAFIRK